MRPRGLIRYAFSTLLLTTALAAQAATQELWIHLRVAEKRGSHAKVAINLPLGLFNVATAKIPSRHVRNGRIHFCNHDMTVDDLRSIWREAGSRPDTWIEVKEDDHTFRAKKSGGYLVVEGTDWDDDDVTTMRIPATIVDALLSARGNDLNLAAAVDAMAKTERGEVMTVSADDADVRMWVDRNPEGAE